MFPDTNHLAPPSPPTSPPQLQISRAHQIYIAEIDHFHAKPLKTKRQSGSQGSTSNLTSADITLLPTTLAPPTSKNLLQVLKQLQSHRQIFSISIHSLLSHSKNHNEVFSRKSLAPNFLRTLSVPVSHLISATLRFLVYQHIANHLSYTPRQLIPSASSSICMNNTPPPKFLPFQP